MKFSVEKSENEVKDVCIAYGLCKILYDNDISWELSNKQGSYNIESQNFEIDDLSFNPITEEECKTVNSSLTKKELGGEINNTNNFIEENLKHIFLYYLSPQDKANNLNMDKYGSIGIGTYFYTKSIRGSTSAKAFNIYSFERHLAFLGFINAANYITNDDVETNSVLIPKKTSEVIRTFQFKSTDKETGEIKVYHMISGESDIGIAARIYLEMLMEYKYIKENYKEIIFMQLRRTTNKPLPDKIFKLPIYNWSVNLCDSLNKKLIYSNVSYDVKDVTARFILNVRYENLSRLVHIYSKKGDVLDYKYKEEILDMYSDKVQRIYNNASVQKLGKAFNRLLYDKKGFEVQAKLYNISNEIHISTCIRGICDLYIREFKFSALDKEELLEIINLVEDKKDAKILADALLAYGKVFIKFKNEVKEEKN